MHNRWLISEPLSDQQHTEAAALAGQLRVTPLFGRLLVRLGWTTMQEAESFLRPKLTHLRDPVRLPGVSRAAKRLARAIDQQQPIVVYGDYDVDGITASAILWHTLKLAGAKVSTYVPHRIEEGYGLNVNAMTELCQADPKPVIVSVDCGITAVEPAQVAREAGVDLIVTDHHEFDMRHLPDAYALVHPRVIDPKRPSDDDPDGPYPFEGLCGAGVALKLAWQTARLYCGSDRLPTPFRNLLMDLLSLAALGTVADVVPLVDENRVIAHYGLGRIKRTGFVGLNALIDASKLRGRKVDAYHVGFVLGPRLNACGRMGHADDAVELMITEDEDRATELAAFLTKENNRRRETEKDITNQAKQMVIDRGYDQPDHRAIVVGNEGWHQGVVGIVASRLVDTFCRPSIVLDFGSDNGNGNGHSDPGALAQGSARSIDGFSIHEALQHCEPMLISFGGHAMAAGLKLNVEHVDDFRRKLVDFANKALAPQDLTPALSVLAECTLDEIDIAFCRQLPLLSPFGRSNPEPVLCVRNVTVDQPPTVMGKTGAHLRLVLRQGATVIKAVGFGMGELADDLPRGAAVDVVFEPKLSEWRGLSSAEIHIKDVKLR